MQINVGNSRTRALVDTGSAVSLISALFYSHLQKEINLIPCNTPFSLVSITGDLVPTVGCVILPCRIDDRVYHHPFLVTATIDNNEYEAILGIDFFKKHKLTLYMQDSRKPIIVCATVLTAVFTAKLEAPRDVPARAETVVQAKVQPSLPAGAEVVVDPEGFQLPPHVYVTPSIGIVDEAGYIPVKLINTHIESVRITNQCKLASLRKLQHPEVLLAAIAQKQDSNAHRIQKKDFSIEHLAEDVQNKLWKVLARYLDVFAKSALHLGTTKAISHKIQLTDNIPVRKRPYRVPQILRKELDNQIKELLEAKIITPSVSAYAAPVVLVKKKQGGYRLCVDYRALNAKTVADVYPLPLITETVDLLANSRYYSSLDLMSGYHQVPVDLEDQHKTAFIVESGLFQFRKLPFGLKNAPSTFERLMDFVLAGLKEESILVYMDDILIASSTIEEHLEKLEMVFKRLRQYNLKLKPSKCQFLKTSVTYLGYLFDQGGVRPDPKNVEAILNFPTPKDIKGVQSFLGMVNFYRRFIPFAADLTKPLTLLLKKGMTFNWTTETQQAFEQLKQHLGNSPLLVFPDFSKVFYLYTDASNHAVGAVLEQVHDKYRRPIAYMSKTLNPAQQNYSTIEREALAIVEAVQFFKTYLYGRRFILRSDHAPLQYILKKPSPSSRLMRWSLLLQEFDIQVEYVAGSSNKIADALSRNTQTIAVINKDPWIDFVYKKQREDPALIPIIELLEGKPSKSVLRLPDGFYLQDGILYHLSFVSQPTRGEPCEQLVVPNDLKLEILRECHADWCSGHFALAKTLNRIRSAFFWFNMYADAKRFVQSCPACMERKGYKPSHKAHLMQAELPSYPWQKAAMDILGPLPLTERGNKYILLVVDYFTKYPEGFSLPDQKAETIARVLLEEVFSRHGVVESLLSDCGKNFLSKIILEICSRLGVKKLNTTPWHPSSDGLVERLNRTILSVLSYLVNKFQNNWDEVLPFALLSYRTAVHEKTADTPAFLLYGRDLRLPYHVWLKTTQPHYASLENFAEEKLEQMRQVYQIVQENLRIAAQKQGQLRSKTARDKEIRVGSMVYLYTPQVTKGKTKKLARLSSGPHRVTKVLSPVNVEIQLIGCPRKKQIVHVDRLTKVRAANEALLLKFPIEDELPLEMNETENKNINKEDSAINTDRSPESNENNIINEKRKGKKKKVLTKETKKENKHIPLNIGYDEDSSSWEWAEGITIPHFSQAKGDIRMSDNPPRGPGQSPEEESKQSPQAETEITPTTSQMVSSPQETSNPYSLRERIRTRTDGIIKERSEHKKMLAEQINIIKQKEEENTEPEMPVEQGETLTQEYLNQENEEKDEKNVDRCREDSFAEKILTKLMSILD